MRLVSFDMDGTLIRGTSAVEFMAERLGNLEQVQELERLWLAGELIEAQFADAISHTYAGLPVAEVVRHFGELPLIGGIDKALARLRQRGVPCVIATVSYAFCARVLCQRYGFDDHCGAEMHEAEGVLAGRMARYFQPQDKVHFVAAFAAARGIAMREVTHVGDSRSDLPLFAAVGTAVALNATPDARAVAHHAIDTDNLEDVLDLLGL